MDIEQYALSILNKAKKSKKEETILTSRESTKLEYKETFSIPNFQDTLNTIAGFANNKGGMILYGIQDKPKIAVGMQDSRFENTDNEKLQSIISGHLSGRINCEIQSINFDKKIYGIVYINEAHQKPVIIKKNGRKVKEGDIYFRRCGQTRRISYEELHTILEDEKNKQIKKWANFIKKADVIGIENAQIFNAKSGILSVDDKEIIVDQSILDGLNHIREGEFDEVNGAPAIKIVGELKNVGKVVATKKINILDDYPYSAIDVANEVKKQRPNCNRNNVWKIIFDNNLKKSRQYSAYNFRNKKQEEDYDTNKNIPPGTPSIYNRKAVDFIVSKLP